MVVIEIIQTKSDRYVKRCNIKNARPFDGNIRTESARTGAIVVVWKKRSKFTII